MKAPTGDVHERAFAEKVTQGVCVEGSLKRGLAEQPTPGRRTARGTDRRSVCPLKRGDTRGRTWGQLPARARQRAQSVRRPNLPIGLV